MKKNDKSQLSNKSQKSVTASVPKLSSGKLIQAKFGDKSSLKNNNNNMPKEEIKIEKKGLFTEKPSKKYTSIKTIDPFADTSKAKM